MPPSSTTRDLDTLFARRALRRAPRWLCSAAMRRSSSTAVLERRDTARRVQQNRPRRNIFIGCVGVAVSRDIASRQRDSPTWALAARLREPSAIAAFHPSDSRSALCLAERRPMALPGELNVGSSQPLADVGACSERGASEARQSAPPTPKAEQLPYWRTARPFGSALQTGQGGARPGGTVGWIFQGPVDAIRAGHLAPVLLGAVGAGSRQRLPLSPGKSRCDESRGPNPPTPPSRDRQQVLAGARAGAGPSCAVACPGSGRRAASRRSGSGAV